jgi:hypothetical protein
VTKIAILQAGTPASSLAQEPDLGYRRIHGEVSLLSYKAYRLTTLGRRGAIATHQRKTLAMTPTEQYEAVILS